MAAGWPPGAAEADVHVVVSPVFAVFRVATWLPAAPAAAGAPAEAACAPPCVRFCEIVARSAAASAGVITGLLINEFMALEMASMAAATDAGTARQAGMYPIITVEQPGPGVSGLP